MVQMLPVLWALSGAKVKMPSAFKVQNRPKRKIITANFPFTFSLITFLPIHIFSLLPSPHRSSLKTI